MDKLTFDAVPTEDGPFCDKSHDLKSEYIHEVPVVYSITLEDIENDELTFNDKKATFSVKYADFLTNNEIETFNRHLDCSLVLPSHVDSSNRDNVKTLNDFTDNSQSTKSPPKNRVSLPAINNKFQSQPTLVVPPFSENDCLVPNTDNNNLITHNDIIVEKPSSEINSPKPLHKKNNRVKIISEKKIVKSIPIKGKLEPVSPSIVLRVRNKNSNSGTSNIENIETTKSVNSQEVETSNKTMLAKNNDLFKKHPRNHKSLLKSSNKSSCDNSPTKNVINHELSSPNMSLLRNKIPPERVAAIEEKRNFNKKLRDMIEFCLDDHDKNVNEITKNNVEEVQNNVQIVMTEDKPKRMKKTRKCKLESISTGTLQDPHPPIQSGLSGISEFSVVNALEARLKMMEETLLRRIELNSKQIVDLKKDIPSLGNKRTIPTQTSKLDNEEVYKKHLYKEISQYLSPEANSLIYEELFINKFGKNVSQTEHTTPSQSKRRRYML